VATLDGDAQEENGSHQMNRREAVVAIFSLPVAVRRSVSAVAQDGGPWRPLFNARDLAGWDSYLGKPYKLSDVPGLPRNESGEYTQPLGLHNDPNGVFSVLTVDGGPAIRVSGEIFGALITREEYENYHLRLDFRWGEKRWPPRDQAVRDSGCCYHSVGPHGASYGFWMQSFEFQIQEKDCGDFYSLAGVIVDSEAIRKDPDDPKSDLLYKKGAPRIVGNTRRIIKDPDNEKPNGQWNTVELYCFGQTSVHVVNGAVNMILTGLRRKVDDREVPLTKGRIQLQSEGCEVFYRNVAVRPIREIPKRILA
jgi:hypothetical protein